MVVIGAGNSGAHAVQMAAGMGARVTVMDLDTRKLEALDNEYRGRVVTLMSNPANIASEVAAKVTSLPDPDSPFPRAYSGEVVLRWSSLNQSICSLLASGKNELVKMCRNAAFSRLAIPCRKWRASSCGLPSGPGCPSSSSGM